MVLFLLSCIFLIDCDLFLCQRLHVPNPTTFSTLRSVINMGFLSSLEVSTIATSFHSSLTLANTILQEHRNEALCDCGLYMGFGNYIVNQIVKQDLVMLFYGVEFLFSGTENFLHYIVCFIGKDNFIGNIGIIRHWQCFSFMDCLTAGRFISRTLIIITGGRLCKGAAVCFIWCRISGCNQPHRKHIAVYRSRCKCLTVYIRYSCNGFYWYR